jgi:hypothetical protein
MIDRLRRAARFRPGELGLIVSLGAVLVLNPTVTGISFAIPSWNALTIPVGSKSGAQ